MKDMWIEAQEELIEDFIDNPYDYDVEVVAQAAAELSDHYREEYLESLL